MCYYLGRDHDAPIAIPEKHASVSHSHATITIDKQTGKWTLKDLDSTNGTYIGVDGEFRRIASVEITPDTWIRLGEEGHRGYYFKARRVLRPNDYREDFEDIKDTYQELEQAKEKLDSMRKNLKFLTPLLMAFGWGISSLPGIRENFNAVRVAFMIPGCVAPFIQEAFLKKLNNKVKDLQKELICPKCRRMLSRDDIMNKEHLYCHAH